MKKSSDYFCFLEVSMKEAWAPNRKTNKEQKARAFKSWVFVVLGAIL